MTDKQLQALLAEKTEETARQNIAVVMSPDIIRHAARLKKKRQDRMQTLLCIVSALVFAAGAAALGWVLKDAENPQEILRTAGYIALGCMGTLLLCAPALAWCVDEEGHSEA